jgi:hypothetical protein
MTMQRRTFGRALPARPRPRPQRRELARCMVIARDVLGFAGNAGGALAVVFLILVMTMAPDAHAASFGGGNDPFGNIGSRVDTASNWFWRFIQIAGIIGFCVAIGTLFLNKANKVWIISCFIGLVIMGSMNLWISWLGLNGSSTPFQNIYSPGGSYGAELPADFKPDTLAAPPVALDRSEGWLGRSDPDQGAP